MDHDGSRDSRLPERGGHLMLFGRLLRLLLLHCLLLRLLGLLLGLCLHQRLRLRRLRRLFRTR